ncbi:aminotransferase [Chenggangzhangella methanolivorans]|uniref:aspartate transaminase n=1 Tax=Chenggangzhangella methanolivorans TaxID=1437009 RepID=A0A9E6RBE2_9HYPH|nr:aminotransferase [Chenggangzhangella methanolivorans]QZO00204.1 aminotransferase [Chenggangzhangella methanolivorans]
MILNSVYSALPVTVFERMSQLARECGAVNLGQGFPDDPGPEDVRRKAAEAVVSGSNQYPPMMGLPELRRAVAAHYGRWQGLELDPDAEVMVTSGATEAIACALFGLVEPGDEVVLLQPLYDAYLPLVCRAGAVPRFVSLAPPDWRIDEDALRAVVGPKTKAVLLNNPLNPSGAVYSREDLETVARAIQDSNALVIADEVWEHVVFDGRAHVSAMAVEGLADRTVKIGSAGKMFGMTGWKVGFLCARPDILKVLAKAHQFLTFTTPPNLQSAVAYGLGKERAWFEGMRAGLQAKRDRFAAGLARVGLAPLESAGTYFLNVDLSSIGVADDVAFCERLVREARVASIPVSAFYAENAVRTVARFCFAKDDATLDEAVARIAAFRP